MWMWWLWHSQERLRVLEQSAQISSMKKKNVAAMQPTVTSQQRKMKTRWHQYRPVWSVMDLHVHIFANYLGSHYNFPDFFFTPTK
jgi:hypothetical protein